MPHFMWKTATGRCAPAWLQRASATHPNLHSPVFKRKQKGSFEKGWFWRMCRRCGFLVHLNVPFRFFLVPGNIRMYQGQISAQGILHLRNPNLGLNSGKRILGARILDPNSRVEFFEPVFSSKRGPQKNSPSSNSPFKIHLPKFNPEIGPKTSHCTSAGPFD